MYCFFTSPERLYVLGNVGCISQGGLRWVVAFWPHAAYSANYTEIVGSTLLSVGHDCKLHDGDSISKLQIVIEKNRMEIMTYKQHLFFNIISIQI